MELKIKINNIHGSQMAAKINGKFTIDENSFRFTAIAFGRIGGQNVGAKLSKETQNQLKKLGYNVDQIIMEIQKNLLQGNLSLPEDIKRETFVDD